MIKVFKVKNTPKMQSLTLGIFLRITAGQAMKFVLFKNFFRFSFSACRTVRVQFGDS